MIRLVASIFIAGVLLVMFANGSFGSFGSFGPNTGEQQSTDVIVGLINSVPTLGELGEAIRQHAAWEEIQNSTASQTVRDTVEAAYRKARDAVTYNQLNDGAVCFEVAYDQQGTTLYAGVLHIEGSYHTYKGEPASICENETTPDTPPTS